MSASVDGSVPVFYFLGRCGKFEDEISRRIRCPGLKTLAVYPRSISYSYAVPGSISDGTDFDPLRKRARITRSSRFCANPSGCTSTSLAVKSVSRADDVAQNVTLACPTTGRLFVRGALV